MTGNAPRTITSLTNDRIKAIRALDMRKVRKETGLFVVEGTSILVSARELGRTPETLVTLAGSAHSGIPKGLVEGALKAGAECLEVSQQVLEKLSGKDNPQTMMGVFRQVWHEPPTPTKPAAGPAALSSSTTWIALEEVRDPGNLGTIIRTCEAFGASGIILVGSCADAYSRESIRATMGSIFAVPLVRMTTDPFLALVRGWPGDTIATHLDAAEDVRTARFSGPTLVVMGSEGPGLSPEVTMACTRRVKIPMSGRLDSLNLAIATAITLFEVRRPHLSV